MPSLKEGPSCKLCDSHSNVFWVNKAEKIEYYKCTNCKSVFQSEHSFLSQKREKERYLNHENNIEDKGYQDFVSPITKAVSSDFKPEFHCGLDFGCGTGPVITYVLEKQGYNMTLYDPFFFPDNSYIKKQYDFIACCEVMEHFHSPFKEFQTLKNLLKPNGKLYCKTALISNEITPKEFSNWYYKNDPTHVFLYSPKSLHYIKNAFNFSDLVISEKLITFIV